MFSELTENAKVGSYSASLGRMPFQHHEQLHDNQAWEKCQAALFVTDPRSDKESILSVTGGIVPGTCEWIRSNERFTLWLQAPNSQFLWICGSPGTGKTALAVYLTEIISTTISLDSELIFYFCHYADPQRRTATNILRSLIWLLLHIRPDLYTHIWSDFRAMQEKLFTSSSAFETLWRIFTAMVKDPSLRSVYCVIDGLDECEGTDVGDLIRKLEALSTAVSEKAAPSFVFKVIVLGRYDLIRACKELSTVPSLRLDSDAAIELRGDIEAVIFAKVQELSRLGSYTLQLQSTVEEAFRRGAKGTFLWVGLMAKDFKQKKTSEVARTLQALPTGLSAAYERLFLEIPDNDRDFLAVVLRWVTVAVRPLSLTELGLITALDCPQGLSLESVAREYIDQYPSLLKFDSSGVVAFHHQFTREFLIREDVDVSPRLQHFKVNQTEAHLDMATFCLNYVIQAFQNFGHRWYRGVWDWEAPPRDCPLIDYASLCWPIHARHAISANSDLFSSSSSFWQEHSAIREAWLEYYQLKAKSPVMISADLTPFQTASYFGLNSFISCLLHSGTWIMTAKQRNLLNKHSKDGFSPLVLAVLGSHTSTVELLLSEGADVNAVDPLLQRTALMQAAYLGNVPILKILVRHGANIHIQDGFGTGAITIAAEQQNTSAAQYLVTEANVLFTGIGQYQRTVPEFLDLKTPLALGLNGKPSAAPLLRDRCQVLLLGSAVVGKTSLMSRYVSVFEGCHDLPMCCLQNQFDKEFKDFTLATIGVDFRVRAFSCDGHEIRCRVSGESARTLRITER